MSAPGPTPSRPPGAARRFLQERRALLALILACWTLVGLFYGTRPYLGELAGGKPADVRGLAANVADAYAWALFTPPILWLAGRFRFERGARARSLALHLAAAVGFALAGAAVNVAVGKLLWQSRMEFWPYVASTFHWNVQWYWIIVGVRYAWEYYGRYRDRELHASRLEAQLARAQLEALRSQIQPHFLFNTLNTISELVHESPAEADRMIVRLGDLLRLSVDNAGAQEVTLRRELDFLRAYLEIEQARFRDRLSVTLAVDPDTLDARVPNLLLQPLVENALRHGIAERAGPGCIEVSAEREGGRLRLEVRDDGGGLPAGGALRERVGLGNTRARLLRLYGDEHRFEVRGAPGGGVSAAVTLPLRLDGAGGEPAHAGADGGWGRHAGTRGASDADPFPGG
ncbi:MAG TPA: histidine kinase [Longimicrobiaceae bacterium]|jgi:signal transduction histidine kinase